MLAGGYEGAPCFIKSLSKGAASGHVSLTLEKGHLVRPPAPALALYPHPHSHCTCTRTLPHPHQTVTAFLSPLSHTCYTYSASGILCTTTYANRFASAERAE